jgi:hypothetical protein
VQDPEPLRIINRCNGLPQSFRDRTETDLQCLQHSLPTGCHGAFAFTFLTTFLSALVTTFLTTFVTTFLTTFIAELLGESHGFGAVWFADNTVDFMKEGAGVN